MSTKLLMLKVVEKFIMYSANCYLNPLENEGKSACKEEAFKNTH